MTIKKFIETLQELYRNNVDVSQIKQFTKIVKTECKQMKYKKKENYVLFLQFLSFCKYYRKLLLRLASTTRKKLKLKLK